MSYNTMRRGRSHGSFQNSRSQRPQFKQRMPNIDPARYVQEAVEQLAEEEFIPQHSFQDFGLHDSLVENVIARGYTAPTPIQDQAIPVLLEGRDVVGIANTGTGKTASFLLPFIHKVLNNPEQGVLIMAPTRELAVQIFDELKAFSRNCDFGVALCIGGADMHRQIDRLQQNPHFVIGTPGRLKDLIMRGAFQLNMFTNIVLDEVDRMLDIGFRADILFLISKLHPERHGAFFSATLNNETAEIMHRLLTDPVMITVKKQETAQHIHQDIVRIRPGESKVTVLFSLLEQPEFERVIVFGRTKHGVNKLERQLVERGFRVSAIHGNKSQNARQRSLQDFKRGKVQALLATDVAARGIDISDVSHVINFDEPESYQDYVHRIGRTGRAGKAGKALTFIAR